MSSKFFTTDREMSLLDAAGESKPLLWRLLRQVES